MSLLVGQQAAAVIGPCCEEKTEFGLEFPRPCAVDETLPWLSEHRLAGWLLCWCACVCVSLFLSLCAVLAFLWWFTTTGAHPLVGTLHSCTFSSPQHTAHHSTCMHACQGFYISWSCGCEVLRGPFPEVTSMRLRGELGSPAVSHCPRPRYLTQRPRCWRGTMGLDSCCWSVGLQSPAASHDACALCSARCKLSPAPVCAHAADVDASSPAWH